MATIRKRDNASIFISRIKAVHCQSDFIFYADVPFLRVFDGMMVRAAAVSATPPARSREVRAVELGALVESDPSAPKWRWFALPEADGEEPAELRWPSTPLELKAAARAHLEQLSAAARGAPARSSRTVYTEASRFRALGSEVAVALQVLNTPNAASARPRRVCASPRDDALGATLGLLQEAHERRPLGLRWHASGRRGASASCGGERHRRRR